MIRLEMSIYTILLSLNKIHFFIQVTFLENGLKQSIVSESSFLPVKIF